MDKKRIKIFSGIIFGFIFVMLIFFFAFNHFENTTSVSQDNIQNNQVKIEPPEELLRTYSTGNSNADKILLECGPEPHCTVEALQNLSKSNKKEIVFAALIDILSAYQNVGFYCHENGHHLGMFLYGLVGNFTDAFSVIDRQCGGSVIHGIVENYIVSDVLLNKKQAENIKITDICQNFNDRSVILEPECLHGLGHGLVNVYGNDIFSAIKRCDEIKEPTLCYNGAFMEYFGPDNKAVQSIDDDVLHPCDTLTEKYLPDCYYYVSSHILEKVNYSLDESFKICDGIKQNKSIGFCYAGIGRVIAPLHNNSDQLVTGCQKGDQNFQLSCFIGGETIVIDQMGPENGIHLCNSVPEKLNYDCYYHLGSWLNKFSTKRETMKICSQIENERYRDLCTFDFLKKIKCHVFGASGNITDSVKCGIGISPNA